MNAPTKVITAHVPQGLAERVDAAASRIDRSRGWVVKQALADWVDREEMRHQMTLEALASVDADRLIEHEAMKRWADSLGTDNPLPAPKA